MERFEKIKRITQILIAEKEYEKHQARRDGKSHEYVGEIYANLVGLKTVYNMILDIEADSVSVSDEMIEKMWHKEIPPI